PGTPWKPVLKKPLHVVIVCFDLKGDRKDEYLMTVYAALSIFKKHAQYDPSQINVHIYTDNDAPFHYIKDKVNIRVMTRPEMDAWMNQGADPYVFFIKMEVLKEMAASTTDPFFFMDSDIIMLKDLKPVVESLSKDVSFMAKAEYKLNERTNTQGFMQNLRQMCDDGDTTALHIKSELGGLSDHFLSGEMMMWNAGIVGLDPSNFDIIDKSIALTKEFLEVRKTMAPEFHIHTIEQISYALFLSMQSKLYPAEHYLNHYWGDKPTYIHKIKVFLDKVYDEGISFDDLIYTNKHDDIWFYSV
ncbi:MAG: hypothetical protein QGH47_07575, partial [Candidatus Woesearchaeota archaeon]|nr:hypothetical protein [Candidatus Woesearchaeota archaeon]